MKLLIYFLLFLSATAAFSSPNPYNEEKASADAEYAKERRLHPEYTAEQRKSLKKGLLEKAAKNALAKMRAEASKPQPGDDAALKGLLNKPATKTSDKVPAPAAVGRSSGPSNQQRVTNTGGEGAVTGGADDISFKGGKNTGANGQVGSKEHTAGGAETIKFGK